MIAVLWVCTAVVFAVGVLLLAAGLDALFADRPRYERVRSPRDYRRRSHRHPALNSDGYSRSEVVDGRTVPSVGVQRVAEGREREKARER